MAELILSAVVSLVPEVIAALEGVKVNKKTCSLLAQQWGRLQPTLPTLRRAENFGQTHMNALEALEQLGRDTIAFVAKFNRKGFFNKGWNHRTDMDKFRDLGTRLSSLIQELQLNILTDARVFLTDAHAGDRVVIGAADQYVMVDKEGQKLDDNEDDNDARLGAGTFGKTLRMKHDLDLRIYEVKTVNIKQAEHQCMSMEDVKREAQILSKMDHRYYGSLIKGTKINPSAHKEFWLIMELVEGHTLFHHIYQYPTAFEVKW